MMGQLQCWSFKLPHWLIRSLYLSVEPVYCSVVAAEVAKVTRDMEAYVGERGLVIGAWGSWKLV
jgi:hypothetical protein